MRFETAETGVFDIWDLRFLRALGQCVQLSLHNAQEMEESLDLSNARWRNFQNEILESHEIVGSSQSLLYCARPKVTQSIRAIVQRKPILDNQMRMNHGMCHFGPCVV